jgi:hypothetical protein
MDTGPVVTGDDKEGDMRYGPLTALCKWQEVSLSENEKEEALVD